MTDRYLVIGNPVEHSKSPQIHASFAQQCGQDISYERMLVPVGAFSEHVRKFMNEGGRGTNVTVPFKLDAYEFADDLSERARDARAVNTLSFADGRVHGDNTDGAGLMRDIGTNLGFSLEGKCVLLMGAGGAARGVLLPLLESRPAILVIVNRTVDKAIRLAQTYQNQRQGMHTVISGHSYEDLSGHRFDLVINATSSSLSDDCPPLPSGLFSPDALAYDMMYGKHLTPFLAFAQSENVGQLADGLGMLVEQAAESFLIWRGVRPETQSVIAALRQG